MFVVKNVFFLLLLSRIIIRPNSISWIRQSTLDKLSFGIRIQNSKFKIQNSKFKIQNSKFRNSNEFDRIRPSLVSITTDPLLSSSMTTSSKQGFTTRIISQPCLPLIKVTYFEKIKAWCIPLPSFTFLVGYTHTMLGTASLL